MKTLQELMEVEFVANAKINSTSTYSEGEKK